MIDIIEQRTRTHSFENRHGIVWTAIIGGLVIAIGIQFLLSLLGIGLGASTVHPTSVNGASAQAVSSGEMVWMVITSLVALFAGGWVAARAASRQSHADGIIHGLVVWGLTTIVTFYVVTTAVGSVLGSAAGVLSSAFGVIGSGVSAAAPSLEQATQKQLQSSNMSLESMQEKFQQILQETGNPKLAPKALRTESIHETKIAQGISKNAPISNTVAKQNTNDLLYRFLHDTDTEDKAADRQALINVVAAELHISKAAAAAKVDDLSQQVETGRQQMRQMENVAHERTKQAGDAAAAAVTKAALAGFFLLLLGAIAAAFGGYLSTKRLGTEVVVTDTIVRQGV